MEASTDGPSDSEVAMGCRYTYERHDTLDDGNPAYPITDLRSEDVVAILVETTDEAAAFIVRAMNALAETDDPPSGTGDTTPPSAPPSPPRRDPMPDTIEIALPKTYAADELLPWLEDQLGWLNGDGPKAARIQTLMDAVRRGLA